MTEAQWPVPRLDEPWEKRPFDNSPSQFWLHVPGMEGTSSWPMNEAVLDRILADHDLASKAAQYRAALEEAGEALETCYHALDGWSEERGGSECRYCGATLWIGPWHLRSTRKMKTPPLKHKPSCPITKARKALSQLKALQGPESSPATLSPR